MRTLSLMIAVLAFSISTYSQDQKDPVNFSEKKNEINIGFFNVLDMNALQELGIGYKHSTDRGALRVATGFTLNTENREADDYEYDNSGFELSPRIGYEFHQNFNRLRLYYGVDFVTSFYKSVHEETFPVIDPYETTTYTRKINQVGLRPVLGLTVFLSKSVSLSTETYLKIMYYKTSDNQESPDGSSTSTSKGMDVGLGPLGIISLNLHF